MSDGKQISGEFVGCTWGVGIDKDSGEELAGALGGNVLSRVRFDPTFPTFSGRFQEKRLRVGDRIVLTREVDGVSYEIRTAHEIFKCWAPVI
uniref:Uncharacterized protein n=1 Tax=Salix viminalis TaxID=40686 RepID=A0A6N2LGM4_SALVM